jgi:molecular chaperone GrpE
MAEEEVARQAAQRDEQNRTGEVEESLTQQLLEQTQHELAETKDRYMRALADLANLKKRMAQENRDARSIGAISIVEELLPTLDNFERALKALDEGAAQNPLRDGVILIYNQLLEALKRKGLRPIEALGQQFDPYFHEAAARVPTDEVEEGSVVNEILRGYMLGDRVVRPSRVAVAARPDTKEAPATRQD